MTDAGATILRFRATRLDFASAPIFGPESFMARFARGDFDAAGFPRFNLDEDAGHSSRSEYMNADAARRRIDRLNPGLPPLPADTRFVIAGQQAGLLTGPLYTFLKAVSAISLAHRIEERSGRPVRPLFWIAAEDHDVLEVNRVEVGGKIFTVPYEGDLARGQVPQVADISLAGAREPLIAFLRANLPATEFTEPLIEITAGADFSNYSTAFRDLMGRLFAEFEMRFVDPISLRPLTAPALAALVEKWSWVAGAVKGGADTLQAAGVTPPLDRPGIFEIVEKRRVPVEFERDLVRLHDGDVSFREAAEAIRARPADFSPNAALRPLLQDAALPVVATLGGPAELVYLWQIDPVFAVGGVERSRLWPRVSATFIERRVQLAAEKSGLQPDGVLRAREILDAYRPNDTGDERIARVERAGAELLAAIDVFAEKAAPPWLAKSRERLAGTFDKILNGLREQQLQDAGLGRARLEKIADAVLPHGKPQERVENIFHYWNLYGPDFVRRAVEALDPLATAHQIVEISAERGDDA